MKVLFVNDRETFHVDNFAIELLILHNFIIFCVP